MKRCEEPCTSSNASTCALGAEHDRRPGSITTRPRPGLVPELGVQGTRQAATAHAPQANGARGAPAARPGRVGRRSRRCSASPGRSAPAPTRRTRPSRRCAAGCAPPPPKRGRPGGPAARHMWHGSAETCAATWNALPLRSMVSVCASFQAGAVLAARCSRSRIRLQRVGRACEKKARVVTCAP